MKNLLPQGMIQKVVFALFFITGAIFYAQDKTYASSQSYQTNGLLCLGCSVQNPQNAVGNNEDDHSSITIPISLLGGQVEQTLIFPATTTRHFKKIVIGIGSPNHILSAKLLGGEAYVESYSGTTPNGDKTLINNNMLELAQNQKKGTIEFTPTKFFDRIKITLNGGGIGVNDVLQIYYAYHTPDKFTNCGNPPLDPLAYYSFDGNTNDIISDYNLTLGYGNINFIPNDIICGNSVYAGQSTGSLIKNFSGNKIKTMAFWVKMDNVPLFTDGNSFISIILDKFSKKIRMYADKTDTPNMIKVDEWIITDPFEPNLIYLKASDNLMLNELAYFTLVYDEEQKKLCLYKNGILSSKKSCGILANSEPDDDTYQISLQLQRAKIDELLIYDRALTSDEVKALACSYGILPNCTSGTSAPASKIAVPTETFTVSPNPTTGEITLDGNILLVGSDISIRNTSGTEVYHSAFRSRTFELPATLPGGVYMLTLQTKDKKVYTRKIILTR
ncbi:T9SS type A sorting domain-containing protein [Chryseobacterium sp.]|uniref:T9SS type A sorting domain-containing protein n=1 Tax=Chryseobacterium sp. TaxID=1871047 RepID=UPI00334215ED